MQKGLGKVHVVSRSPLRIAVIGNYPPRKCGIATFSADTQAALEELPEVESFVVAMEDGTGLDYSQPVRRVLPQHDRSAYRETGRWLRSQADLILLQHEYGIFGGDAGDYILDLIEEAGLPVVTVLHTILATPNVEQRRVLEALSERSSQLVSMSKRGRDMLETIYGVAPNKIALVPHGVPDRPYVEPFEMRAELGWEERPTLLTFGLLSPNKGIETMIDAMPALIREVPDVRYLVLGVTHPHLVRHEGGERYRAGLMARAEQRGVAQHIEFRNDFLELEALCDWLQATDVYVTPYRDEAQITSGTLAYAHGLGKPIVSTPYWHAAELLADNHAQLVPFGDADALAEAIAELLTDKEKRNSAAARAYARGRGHIWSEAARRYDEIFRAALRSKPTEKALPPRTGAVRPGGGSHAALAPFRALRHRLGGEAAKL